MAGRFTFVSAALVGKLSLGELDDGDHVRFSGNDLGVIDCRAAIPSFRPPMRGSG
jgi:hypothetical protein